jgi:short-subunit dehydrogenase
MQGTRKKLSEQVIVITGATSGIGLATARLAAQHEAKLILAARNEDAVKELGEEFERRGVQALPVQVDVGSETDMQRLAKTAFERFGHIDTWINNAGVSIFGRHEEVATEDMRRLFETNFWGVVYGSLAAVRYMKTQGGTIINMGSGFSDCAAPIQGMYSASKHAVKGFTDSLRMELESEGTPISVTLIKPASINSMLTEHAKSYLDVAPRLPPPVYAPEVAARAVLRAAEQPQRDIYVGGAARLLAMGGYYLPRLLDRAMASLLIPLQRTRKPPYPDSRHNLHRAARDLQERGPMDAYVFERSWYTEAVTHPRARQAALLGVLASAALWSVWRSNKIARAGSGCRQADDATGDHPGRPRRQKR